MSETPETDALVSVHDEAAAWVEKTAGYNDLLQHARTLETALAAATAEVERLKRDAELWRELLASAKAFQSYADGRYNADPSACAVMNCQEQQRLWRAIAALSERADKGEG